MALIDNEVLKAQLNNSICGYCDDCGDKCERCKMSVVFETLEELPECNAVDWHPWPKVKPAPDDGIGDFYLVTCVYLGEEIVCEAEYYAGNGGSWSSSDFWLSNEQVRAWAELPPKYEEEGDNVRKSN